MALAAAVLSLSGCGGSGAPSLSAFKSGFQTDRTRFRQLGVDLGKTITAAGSKTNAQLATELSGLSSRATAQATELSKLNPPAKYQPDMSRLVAGFKTVAADLRRISDAAAHGDAQTASAATRSLIADAQTVKAADLAVSDSLSGPGGH